MIHVILAIAHMYHHGHLFVGPSMYHHTVRVLLDMYHHS